MQVKYLDENNQTSKMEKHWQFCVGSGHASLALRADYMKLLKQVHQDLGIQRVRFHGIFCDDMKTIVPFQEVFPLPMSLDIWEYSFRQCAIAYDNLLEAGVKPFVELGFMPSTLAEEDVCGMFYYKPNICMPKDDNQWKKYIQSFICFLIDRYGKQEILSWYFEIWNEPDLVLPFFHGTQEDYFHLYEITVQAIKQIDDKIMVGGPATSGSKWIEAFMKYCTNKKVPVDFVTTHQYAGDPIGGIQDQGGPENDSTDEMEEMKEVFQPEELKKRLDNAPKDAILPAFRTIMGDPLENTHENENGILHNASIVKKQAQGKPVYYTEWNTCATFGAYTNDTRKVAAFDLKTALGLDGVVEGSSIWCFSDIFEEFHQFPEEFHGGFGLMTQSGIKKPVYYALEILNRVGAQRYILPGELEKEIGMAAFKTEKEVQILLFRQKLQNRFDLPKEKIRIEISMKQKPKEVIVERIDEEHCNPLRVWEEMGWPQVPNKKQVSEIQSKSELCQEKWEYQSQNGIVTCDVELGVNDIYFVRIIR